jgi:hypothetical protein
MKPFTFKRNFTAADSINYVVFTKASLYTADYVVVSGSITSSINGTTAIRGTSKGFKVLPRSADHVSFYDPPSKGVTIVDPDTSVRIVAIVYDQFDNLVDKSGVASVSLRSTRKTIGDVAGDTTLSCDSLGRVSFKIKVTNGNKNDTFPIIVTLPSTGSADTAKCVVGRSSITAIKQVPKTIPSKGQPGKITLKLGPNPFKPASGQILTIELVPGNGTGSTMLSGIFKIFDGMGNVVTVLNVSKSSGKFCAYWDGKNMKGVVVGAGTYFMKADVENRGVKTDVGGGGASNILIGVRN